MVLFNSFLCCVYFPLGDSIGYPRFATNLESLLQNNHVFLVCGDDNMGSIDWVCSDDSNFTSEPYSVEFRYFPFIEALFFP